jgi:hypothetical protein
VLAKTARSAACFSRPFAGNFLAYFPVLSLASVEASAGRFAR